MKKILFLLLVTGMLVQPAWCDVQQTVNEVQLKGEFLKSKYSAFEIQFLNTGKNPVKITNIEIPNAVSNVESMMSAYSFNANKKDRKLLYLSPLTFGITGIVYTNKVSETLDKQKEEATEAMKYNAPLATIATTGQVLVNGMTKNIYILVPKDEKPNISAVFQDTKTNEYIKAK